MNFKAVSRRVLRWLMRSLVERRIGLRLVNAVHARLPPKLKQRFFYVFYDEDWHVEGQWHVDFAGVQIILPLSRDVRYAWMAATAFHGYDPDLHDFYATLVRSPRRPRLFFDVGASYGLHSLRMLVHGVRVVSFEPNPTCHHFFRRACALNGVTPRLEPFAVGDAPGMVDLTVPGDRTWLGSIMPGVQGGWGDDAVQTWRVPQLTLDDYVAQHALAPDVIKIDVEGAEEKVLRGARRLLASAPPMIVFESFPSQRQRAALHGFLDQLHYAVGTIGSDAIRTPMTREQFLASLAKNFVAVPSSESTSRRGDSAPNPGAAA